MAWPETEWAGGQRVAWTERDGPSGPPTDRPHRPQLGVPAHRWCGMRTNAGVERLQVRPRYPRLGAETALRVVNSHEALRFSTDSRIDRSNNERGSKRGADVKRKGFTRDYMAAALASAVNGGYFNTASTQGGSSEYGLRRVVK